MILSPYHHYLVSPVMLHVKITGNRDFAVSFDAVVCFMGLNLLKFITKY